MHKATGSETKLGAALRKLDTGIHCCEMSCSHAAFMAVQSLGNAPAHTDLLVKEM